MPSFNFLKHLRRLPAYLNPNGMDGEDIDPAELEQVRRALPPMFSGEPNPATRPRPVAPAGNLTGPSDRPPAMVNRPRLPMPVGPSPIPGGEPPRPAMLDREVAPPTKSYGHERLDYRDQNAGRGFKQSMRAGLRGGLESMRNGGQGGGFLGGMLGNLIDPQGEADRQFAAGPGRRILERQDMQRDDELYGLKKRGLEATAAENEAQAARIKAGTYKDAPFGTYNDATGQIGYERPALPRARKMIPVVDANGKTIYVDENDPNQNWQGLQPYNKPAASARPMAVSEGAPFLYNPSDGTWQPNPGYNSRGNRTLNESLGEREAAEGDIGQIAADSLAGREDAILNQLTPREREVLAGDAPPLFKTVGGQSVEQSEVELNNELLQTQKRYEALKARELSKITRETRSKRYSDARADMVGKSPVARPTARGGSKPISRAVVEKYAKDNGVSYAEALKDAQADGYTVK